MSRTHLETKPRGSTPASRRRQAAQRDDALPSEVRLLAYGPDGLVERPLESLSEVPTLLTREGVVWFDVVGLATRSLIEGLAKTLELHSLAIEDVLNPDQRPKLDLFDTGLFIVLRAVHAGAALATRQVSLYLGKNFVVTFQERHTGCFEAVRERLRHGRGRVRGNAPDFLMYLLLDGVIDAYFPAVEEYGDELQALEESLIFGSANAVVADILDARHRLAGLRRAVWPLRDALANLSRDDLEEISAETRVYLRDCYDHALQLIDVIETYREVAAGLLEVYVSATSQRTGEVMRVLTIIATIFMPLTFIAGIYGMNFRTESSPWNMPELEWAFGYPFALSLMALTALALVFYFWRKGWLATREVPARARRG